MRMKDLVSTSRRQALLVALCLVAASLPLGFAASAQEVANIEFLNPSSFAATPDVGIIVSDKIPEEGDETYRLSAWVSGVPQTPAVEFELLTRQGLSLAIIDQVRRVGTDTFEADWDIPDTLPDGPYTIRATLASGVLGIDSVDQHIVIQRLAERAEITYPDTISGPGQYGMYVPLATSTSTDAVTQPNPVGNIENNNTGMGAPGAGPSVVRAFYTTSSPGTPPQWLPCGTEAAGGNAIPSGAANNGLRCTLASPDDLPRVSAVALVANNSQDEYSESFNQSGDATRVLEPYSQVPTTLTVVEGQAGTVESEEDGSFSCFIVIAEVTDQLGREVVRANLDAHAWGPTDRLKFGTGLFDTYSAELPDRGSHSSEQGVHCFQPTDDQSIGQQGEHQVIGGPDLKHIESGSTGSNDLGQWGFELYTPAGSTTAERHTTRWEVWIDESNDGSGANTDTYELTELCRSGMVGWDGAASSENMGGVTPACPNAPVDPCENQASSSEAEPCPTQSPSPSPSPTASPSEDPGDDESITIRASRKRVARGTRVRFSGTIDAAPGCTAARRLFLQSRRGDGEFKNRVMTASESDGTWSVVRRMRRTTQWRVVAETTSSCAQLTSSIIKIRVRRG